MINYNDVCLDVYYAARHACEEIFKVACRELYAPVLNHLYTMEYREKALEVCKEANASFVKKVYDYNLHDHYNVEVPESIIDGLMEMAVYENGLLKIGSIECSLN